MKLKIFSDRRCLPEGIGHSVMLYPFWGKNPEDPRSPESGRFDRFVEKGSSFFEMSSLMDADFAVMPPPWERVMQSDAARSLANSFAEKAKQVGKRLIIFFCSDSDQDVSFENAVVFRTSLYHSKRKPNEFAMPAWSEDFVEKYLGAKLPVRPKREKPVVGFCGYAHTLEVRLGRTVKDILRRGAGLARITKRTDAVSSKSAPGHVIRAKALRLLSRSPLVRTNFIIRHRFLGGALLPNGREDPVLMHRVRLEYVHNMVESDYILCARGAGNFSYRLYETLCCGRIPVFINTDCVLPYDVDIEWKKYCVWVDESELPLIAEKLANFHSNLSPQDFGHLQHECRRLWEQWLSPEGFFFNFYRHFWRVEREP
ncbi:MAG: exostosin family protein [bacterium]|nr:exostosin family protein [bacterium]